MTDRYSRQELFQPIGPSGQEKLRSSHAVIIGAGALGTASAEMLVRAGVGKVTIADRDYVEWVISSASNFIPKTMSDRKCRKPRRLKNGFDL